MNSSPHSSSPASCAAAVRPSTAGQATAPTAPKAASPQRKTAAPSQRAGRRPDTGASAGAWGSGHPPSRRPGSRGPSPSQRMSSSETRLSLNLLQPDWHASRRLALNVFIAWSVRGCVAWRHRIFAHPVVALSGGLALASVTTFLSSWPSRFEYVDRQRRWSRVAAVHRLAFSSQPSCGSSTGAPVVPVSLSRPTVRLSLHRHLKAPTNQGEAAQLATTTESWWRSDRPRDNRTLAHLSRCSAPGHRQSRAARTAAAPAAAQSRPDSRAITTSSSAPKIADVVSLSSLLASIHALPARVSGIGRCCGPNVRRAAWSLANHHRAAGTAALAPIRPAASAAAASISSRPGSARHRAAPSASLAARATAERKSQAVSPTTVSDAATRYTSHSHAAASTTSSSTSVSIAAAHCPPDVRLCIRLLFARGEGSIRRVIQPRHSSTDSTGDNFSGKNCVPYPGTCTPPL